MDEPFLDRHKSQKNGKDAEDATAKAKRAANFRLGKINLGGDRSSPDMDDPDASPYGGALEDNTLNRDAGGQRPEAEHSAASYMAAPPHPGTVPAVRSTPKSEP